MHRALLTTMSLCAILIVPMLAPHAQAKTPLSSPKLEGMGYQRARKIIVGYGWGPLTANCYGASKAACAQYPEIQACSGIAPGYCGMVFVNKSRCLYVTTTGGEPLGQGEGDTHVIDVSFRAGPCFKG